MVITPLNFRNIWKMRKTFQAVRKMGNFRKTCQIPSDISDYSRFSRYCGLYGYSGFCRFSEFSGYIGIRRGVRCKKEKTRCEFFVGLSIWLLTAKTRSNCCSTYKVQKVYQETKGGIVENFFPHDCERVIHYIPDLAELCGLM